MRNDGYTYHDRITSADDGEELLEYYTRRYPHSTREDWRMRITAGAVRRNGVVTTEPGAELRAGDRLEWQRPPWDEEDVPTNIPVLAETEGWIVLHKPSGLPVLPGGGYLCNTLLWIARARHGASLSPVHRLGRGTSGAILFSRDVQSARALARAMREGKIRKTYLALVQGCDMPERFTVAVPIGPVPHAPLGMLHAASSAGKPSESHCAVLYRDRTAGHTLLQVEIPTGRPHQIRIHCAAAGYPLAGDPLYLPGGGPAGTTAVPGDCGYHLHSWKIRFPEPKTGESRLVIAAPPEILTPPAGSSSPLEPQA